MAGLETVATVPIAGWVGIAAMAALLAVAAVRLGGFERLGASLAGDRKRQQDALARTATPDGAERVARFAAMLTEPREVRLIRWTPARTPEGSRIVLGASPMAWYLWLPEPVVLMRIPDSLVGQMHHDDRGEGVVALRCEARASDDCVTATDGLTVEDADNSLELAETLLSGLVIVDPSSVNTHIRRAPAPATAEPADEIRHVAKVASVGAISIAS